jgi:hypothetical protein
MLGEGGTMGSWDVFLRSDQHVHDLAQIDAAIAALSRGRGQVQTALGALEQIYTMESGHLFSPETYQSVMDWMISDSMYWGDDFDQQQAYVDVHAIHRALQSGGSLSDAQAGGEVGTGRGNPAGSGAVSGERTQDPPDPASGGPTHPID